MKQQRRLPRHQSGQNISTDEWQLRIKLAAAYRMVEYFGWSAIIYGHLTARVPGPECHFLINPYGLNYEEITASNLVKIDQEGKVISSNSTSVNYAGFVIHSSIHMSNTDANQVVMHTHSKAGMAVAALKHGLQFVSMGSTVFYNRLAYHNYEGVSLRLDERERLLSSLGQANAMILRNHGLLVVGRTVPETFLRLYRLEMACQVQLDAAAAGELNRIADHVALQSRNDIDIFSHIHLHAEGELEFAALMRKIDRLDNSYRN